MVGREGQRGVDEWVFFRQDQLLPCFLVDEPLGLVMASATHEDPVRHSQVQRKTKSTQASRGASFFILICGQCDGIVGVAACSRCSVGSACLRLGLILAREAAQAAIKARVDQSGCE